MKKIKIISNIITLFILVGGLVLCAASYINHTLYCHGCSSHLSHPIIELMIYGLVVLFAGAFFGISRLILRLVGKRKAVGSESRTKSAKLDRVANTLTLLILIAGFIHCAVMFIIDLTAPFGRLIYALMQFLYMIPYVWAAAVIFVVSRLILLWTLSRKGDRSQNEKRGKEKLEKWSYILTLVILLAGFLHNVFMVVIEYNSLLYSYSLTDIFIVESIYMIPYVLTAAAVFGISRLLLFKKPLNKEKLQ